MDTVFCARTGKDAVIKMEGTETLEESKVEDLVVTKMIMVKVQVEQTD